MPDLITGMEDEAAGDLLGEMCRRSGGTHRLPLLRHRDPPLAEFYRQGGDPRQNLRNLSLAHGDFDIGIMREEIRQARH